MSKFLAGADEPARGLEEGFEHQYAGHDFKQRKVISEIVFVSLYLFGGSDFLAGDNFRNAIELSKAHAGICSLGHFQRSRIDNGDI